MEYLQTLLILCPLVFLAAALDAIGGGGGLISLPAYYLAAQAETSLGHGKEATLLRQQAYHLEQKKDSIQSLQTHMQLADNQPQQRDRRKEFSTLAAQNQESNEEENKYESEK